MSLRWNIREHVALTLYVLRWAALVAPVGVLVGSACALFLWSLDVATATREQTPWLLFLLPAGGLGVGLMYHAIGKSVEAGSNLVMEEIHRPGGGVPRRMAPLILVGTVLTHLFGGSAGREGTAVQMGGSIASALSRMYPRLDERDVRTLLMCGVAAGFGGVFGTPLTGAIFALEVLAIGRMSYGSIIPCLMASMLSDWTCSWWGVGHTDYHQVVAGAGNPQWHLDWPLLGKVSVAAVAFGLTSVLFAEMTHGLGWVYRRVMPVAWLRPVLGGVAVIVLTLALGTRDYLGLGVSSSDPGAVTILSSFQAGGAQPLSWWWKLLLTAVTLGAGFKGGEVTPLFFVGASLGNMLAWVLGAPVELMAAIGFVAVFAGATNTPLACTIMAIELFGPQHVVYYGVACFVAYLFSGHKGIYSAQRIGTPKLERAAVREG